MCLSCLTTIGKNVEEKNKQALERNALAVNAVQICLFVFVNEGSKIATLRIVVN